MTDTKFTVGSVWRTRDGRKATVLANDLRGYRNIIIKYDSDTTGTESYIGLSDEGRVYLIEGNESGLDLVEPWREPVTVSGWACLYPDGSLSNLYSTKKKAEYIGKNAFPVLYVTGTEEVV